ncbi:MAG: 1-deoxy-D-xylulose-5-phosphate reductoisomerase, partial [Thermomicrobiales bacterium]
MTSRTASPPPAPDTLGIAVLGSTGSVGRQTLDVVAHHPDRFRVVALAAGSNLALLQAQIEHHHPQLVAVDHEPASAGSAIDHATILFGQEGLITAATHPDVDVVVVATSGHSAIIPTTRAIEAGKTIALANKETIVCAGELIVPLARQHGVAIRPVDSEHSAIWQSLGNARGQDVARLILTASGGPFRTMPATDIAKVTVE